MSHQAKEQLRQAAITLSALPLSSLDKPLEKRSAWPEFIQKSQAVMGQKGDRPKLVPGPWEIDETFAIIDSLNRLPADRRRLVWARACGVPWAALQMRYQASRTHLNLRYKKALIEFSKIHQLN